MDRQDAWFAQSRVGLIIVFDPFYGNALEIDDVSMSAVKRT
jgi:hypothetical protein